MTSTQPRRGIATQRVAADAQSLYALTSDGELAYYRHDLQTGDVAGPWAVATAWDYEQVFSGGDGVIYAVAADGESHW
jgi:hypothetical protein